MQVNSSMNSVFYHCFDSRTAVLIFTVYAVTKILLCCPLSIFVFYLGHQRWRQQRSIKTTSHSDIFTYHAAAMELNGVVGYIFHFSGTYYDIPMMENQGLYFSNMAYAGEMFFHCLTCAERYLAVVHPIIYQGLRQSKGVKVRNISISCVWVLSFLWVGAVALYAPNFPNIIFFCFITFSLLVVSFCSLSVLCALIHPGPGNVGGNEKRVDQSKQRAFHTVMVISAVLWVWFVGIILCIAVDVSSLLSYNDGCVVMSFGLWFTLPGSVVLSLLFLHRAGKLLCCQYRNE